MRLMALRGVERAHVPETLLMVKISLGGRDADQFVHLGPHSLASSRDRLAYAAIAFALSAPMEDECALVRTWSPALSIRRER
jgi:hypothetical protein